MSSTSWACAIESKPWCGRTRMAWLGGARTDGRCFSSGGEAEWRVPVRDQQERVSDDALGPPEDAFDEVEDPVGIPAGEHDGDQSRDHREQGRNPEKHEDDEVRDDEQ